MRPRILVAATVLVGASACSGKSGSGTDTASTASPPSAAEAASRATAASASVTSVPRNIDALGQQAENVYDMVKAGNWVAARAFADSLHLVADSIPGSAAVAVQELNQAIASRNRVAALRASNSLTQLGALLAEPYHPSVPVEVTLLDYQGRELEIWAAAADAAKLRSTAATLRSTWTTVRPKVVARGGASSSAHFDALLTRLAAATTPRQYGLVATPLLDAVDSLERVFTR